MKSLLLLPLFFVFCCNNVENHKKSSTKKTVINEKQTKITTKRKTNQHPNEIKFVNSKTGLIFRDKPKGKRLGKFDFNKKIEITNRTGVFQVIKNKNKEIKGEWVEVLNKNKKVFVFDGFLTDKKQTISFELAKTYLRGAIWVSEEYKNLLEETKSSSEAFRGLTFYLNIIYNESIMDKPALVCDQNYQEAPCFELTEKLNIINKGKVDFKITGISNTKMTIKKNGRTYKFLKSDVKTKGKSPTYIIHKGSKNIFSKWFEGSYSVEGTEINKSIIHSKLIQNYTHDVYEENSDDISYDMMEFRNKTYRVDKIINNTYHLTETKEITGEGDDLILTGQKITLTKLEK